MKSFKDLDLKFSTDNDKDASARDLRENISQANAKPKPEYRLRDFSSVIVKPRVRRPSESDMFVEGIRPLDDRYKSLENAITKFDFFMTNKEKPEAYNIMGKTLNSFQDHYKLRFRNSPIVNFGDYFKRTYLEQASKGVRMDLSDRTKSHNREFKDQLLKKLVMIQ
eukprot:TRINITY_DN14300_c0_g1_i5.p2 TRINITY_DN14300_c0_g1~~TRINITY_DN14300_c0_g1_i5.p2  ORF type:complete len:166 (-),score=20.23 TRINITY_DN14300_c0_g1_i5:232-729(-)